VLNAKILTVRTLLDERGRNFLRLGWNPVLLVFFLLKIFLALVLSNCVLGCDVVGPTAMVRRSIAGLTDTKQQEVSAENPVPKAPAVSSLLLSVVNTTAESRHQQQQQKLVQKHHARFLQCIASVFTKIITEH
jgi:hypothetical protein